MTRLAVVDHGAGNLVSIARGLAASGADVSIAAEPGGLDGAAGIVLPGVGATAPAMARLDAAGFLAPLREAGVPLLGICVGLQLLFDMSEEDGARCLGVLPGRVARLDGAPRLPHIGWNDVVAVRPDPLFSGVAEPVFYFVHSYAPVPTDPETVLARSSYGDDFVVAVRRGRITGVQFHPERSGPAGLQVLANFVAECAAAEVGDAA